MSENFVKNMLIRLKAYRKGKSMSQEKFANSLGIKQTYYSQVENGDISLKYDILKKLYSTNCDIDYIVTGIKKRHKDNFLLEVLENCEPDRVMSLYAMMIISFMQLWEWNLKDHWEKCLHSELMALGVISIRKVSFDEKLYYVRILNGVSQQEFSNLLGIGRTKCGKCEHGEQKLDAQLMLNLYSNGFCLPSFFLEKYIGITEISSLLETNAVIRNKYYAYIKNVMVSFKDD